ncbi:MAG: CusA/CzcA family heavy metal efflux RND transporter [Flavobacteriales bacterium]|nr:CusA/CzcA family heavy metal efflux RND transporter [Flavobacteriales bacterium]
MLDWIISYSLRNKLVVLLFTAAIIGAGVYSLLNLPIGAVPDITNNQVQVITTSRNLATQDVEKYLTYPVELEMANLPGVKEIRSVSKFGLSVVTVVFTDEIGTYLPRQLIAEKIKSAEERIPAGFGKPFMGPVTTGLGEIYQYVIDVKPGYEDRYITTDLRTIQDWVVKRQLSGIPGVVEVNTWGGFLKQYEVAIDPARIRSVNVSLAEIYQAVSDNNSVAGGGYIEKGNESYFIRGEGQVKSLEDIEQIVVTNREGLPIRIKDVAKVGFGHANRFGAITGNGEGEKVLGQVMMLKDADSKKVIDAVKARVEQMESSLPEGVVINAVLERSELIDKTTFTIAENLILGCLIVIFVVVLLLGNLRSGLVVASVIPLTLLFALTLMYIFGVDANLMSLGAIDFGIIIDGAVIIVEYIAFRITAQRTQLSTLKGVERSRFIDHITHNGASKMMRSAVFGQLIILIVFIPILSLTGVEGKMFKPMALVFCFAIMGAMILCFTYVPVIAALFLKPTDPDKKTISSRLMKFLERSYLPAITWALRKKTVVLSSAVALLVVVGLLFTQMGGEFVPTLDEGDFVIQPVLKTGTSLSRTIEITTRIEQILKRFPEVDQVVSRIGAAEVPTDPMSMEESDVMIKLIPIGEWTTAETKDELADSFKVALSVIPGVDYEFTQPIEMRFNELITGVRSDLAIKVFGEDLDVLYRKALEIEKAIKNVEGAADITVEKVAGLPQMTVVYNRQNIAKYGLSIGELNQLIQVGFAGLPTGTVFEGEKQFDLVVRYDEAHRKDIENLRTASVQLPNGSSLPLTEFAEVNYTKGPAKISRDNTKRRIVVGVNVRGRDLESVVTDVQKIIGEQIKLPVGYTVEYGGQFENLRTAKERLMYAVPVALLLIFILLHFAFGSVKEALMIYSAIPLSAVGGVLFLYMRGMPFSISAGVGFIALFGIAVLNGIVLIEHFKELKEHGIKDLNERIILGTQQRLRPVLLTASAAALGFLPMAISTSAGAEIQRPLATVVVGGLITATLLTLLVLPVLYSIFEASDEKKKKKKLSKTALSIVVLMGLLPMSSIAQPEPLTMESAIELALQNNNQLKASKQEVEKNRQLVGAAIDIDKTHLFYGFDQNNIAPNNAALNVWGLGQTLKFPTVYHAQKKLQQGFVALSEQQYRLDEQVVKKEVSKAYLDLVFLHELRSEYVYLDSLYAQFAAGAKMKFDLGETDQLEQLTAQAKYREVSLLLDQQDELIHRAQLNLNRWIQSDSEQTISAQSLEKLKPMVLDTVQHPALRYYQEMQAISDRQLKLERQQLLPDIQFQVFQGTNNAANAQIYSGVQAGLSVPLWFGAQNARIKAAKTERMAIDLQAENQQQRLMAEYQMLLSDLERQQKALVNYQESGKGLSDGMLKSSNLAYRNGEIDFLQFVQLLEHAVTIETNHLTDLLQYNLIVLDINYLNN